MFEVETLKAEEVAKLFKTTPSKITNAILNGTLPIGFVSEGTKNRTIIVKSRLEMWLKGELRY